MKHHLSIFALILAALPTVLAAAETNAVSVAALAPETPAAEKPAEEKPAVVEAKPAVEAEKKADVEAEAKPAVEAEKKADDAETKPEVKEEAEAEAKPEKPAEKKVEAEADDLLADDAKMDDDEASAKKEKKDGEVEEPDVDEAADGTNTVAAAAVVDPKFERYKTILDRMPFGPEPAGFDPDSGATGGSGSAPMTDEAIVDQMMAEEAQRMLAGVRISALNVRPGGAIAVGFTDSSKQPASSYYMKVGETRDGWTVVSADAKEQSVTLARGDVEGTLKLGEGADPNTKGGKGGTGGRPMVGGMMGARPGATGGLVRPTNFNNFGARPGLPQAATGGTNAAPNPNETAGDALARLKARRAEKDAARQAEAARATAAAELAKAEQAKAQAEREKAAAEREQQRQALAQIQEELRRQREQREQQNAEAGAGEGAPAPAEAPNE